MPRSAGVCAAHKRVPGGGIRRVFKGLEHLLGPFPPEAFQDSALGRVLACTEHVCVCVCGEHLQSCSDRKASEDSSRAGPRNGQQRTFPRRNSLHPVIPVPPPPGVPAGVTLALNILGDAVPSLRTVSPPRLPQFPAQHLLPCHALIINSPRAALNRSWRSRRWHLSGFPLWGWFWRRCRARAPGPSVGRAEEPSRGSCSLAGLPRQRHWEISGINQHLPLPGGLLVSPLQQEGFGGTGTCTQRRLCCPLSLGLAPHPQSPGSGHVFNAIFLVGMD